MCPRRNVSSPMLVICLDEISEAVFRGWNKSNQKGRTGKKRLQNVYAHMLRILSCVLLTGKVKLFLEVKM